MDINYFLLCKKKYNNMVSYFENITDECDCIINELIINMQQKNDDNIYEEVKTQLSNIYSLKKQYNEERDRIICLIKECNINIEKMCVHDFVNDSIDISTELSKNICYCTICGYTI
jgi:DNA repair ATPase RecN